MEWVLENWFFILLLALFIGMHLFGFGCGGHSHGEHGGDEGHSEHKHTGERSSENKGGSSCH